MPSHPNRLLASLSSNDFDLLEPHLQSVVLQVRKSLERPNKRIDAVYFPESGFASVVAIQSGGKEVEVGLIGREGMTGLPIVLGNHRSPHGTPPVSENSHRTRVVSREFVAGGGLCKTNRYGPRRSRRLRIPTRCSSESEERRTCRGGDVALRERLLVRQPRDAADVGAEAAHAVSEVRVEGHPLSAHARHRAGR